MALLALLFALAENVGMRAADPLSLSMAAAVRLELRPIVEADWLQQDGGYSLEHTREVIRRGQNISERLRLSAAIRQLRPLTQRLNDLDARLSALETSSHTVESTQREIWLEAHRLVREIAFCNPRLREVGKLLFITRHDAAGVFHMVDQFYGFNAKPGGRLLVLVDPLGNEPRLVDLLGQLGRRARPPQGPLP